MKEEEKERKEKRGKGEKEGGDMYKAITHTGGTTNKRK